MKEDLLQYFWKTHKWKDKIYTTTCGQSIQIIDAGRINTDAGPDFSQARIKIANQLWAGNVEIHTKSSEWYTHRHQNDSAYNSVILHVVWSEDKEVFYNEHQKIPCLELKTLISKDIIDNYERLMNSACWIPCENQISKIDINKASLALHRLVAEKLKDKTELIDHIYCKSGKDWHETLHKWLARGYGLNVNGTAFELLAESIPLKLVNQYKSEALKLEALVFGCSGLLHGTDSVYASKLKIAHKDLPVQIEQLPEGIFKFFRTRPSNFPTIRLAQWLKMLMNPIPVFEKIMNLDSPESFIQFINQPLDGFWSENFTFTTPANGFPTNAGREFGKLLLINSVAPFMFYYGKKTDDETMQQRAIDWLDNLKGEKNQIVRKYQNLGFPAKTASQTQALLWLKKKYCEQKRCMECSFGAQLFKK